MLKIALIDAYLDYFNNFLSVSAWAEYYEIPCEDAESLLQLGSNLHERNVQALKA